MSSGTSTETRPASGAGLQVWQFYLLLSMVGATAAVMLSRETHPAALLLISAAVVGAGLCGWALHTALAGFFSRDRGPTRDLSVGERDTIDREKALTLRSIKELEFDRAMGKIGDADFQDMSTRLRARAISLIAALERESAPSSVSAPGRAGKPPAPPAPSRRADVRCQACGTAADEDARFCKQCGAPLGARA